MTALKDFFQAYRRHNAASDFFQQYRAHLTREDRVPEQNFLLETDLLGHREERWCRVLYWLLHPSTCPRYSVMFQALICTQLACVKMHEGEIFVVHREWCNAGGDLRFDLVLQSDWNRVVIEAKVYADIKAHQYDQYPKAAGKDCAGVYLTMPGAVDTTRLSTNWNPAQWDAIVKLIEDLFKDPANAPHESDEWRWFHIARDFSQVIKNEVRK